MNPDRFSARPFNSQVVRKLLFPGSIASTRLVATARSSDGEAAGMFQNSAAPLRDRRRTTRTQHPTTRHDLLVAPSSSSPFRQFSEHPGGGSQFVSTHLPPAGRHQCRVQVPTHEPIVPSAFLSGAGGKYASDTHHHACEDASRTFAARPK